MAGKKYFGHVYAEGRGPYAKPTKKKNNKKKNNKKKNNAKRKVKAVSVSKMY